jgi:hypothetical protein
MTDALYAGLDVEREIRAVEVRQAVAQKSRKSGFSVGGKIATALLQ